MTTRAATVIACLLAEDDEGVIAVDFDGTLADDSGGWQGIEHTGQPITGMVNAVKRWIEDGRKVVVFTARAQDPMAIPYVEDWCEKHLGKRLPVTCQKSPSMTHFIDDKNVDLEKVVWYGAKVLDL